MQKRTWTSMVLGACVLASCGSIPTKTFEVRAINAKNEEVKCLIVVGHKWPGEGDSPVYTRGTVEVAFEQKTMNVRVKPAQLDAEGNIVAVPRERDGADYKSANRDVEMRDPRVLLFVLMEAGR